ncbi:hypothetical protein Tco_0703418 [Tanacetum coccineum]|uniref:Integrase, catalytic region, zinc finger, CCHC-type, peptidase aspartic, catalytic n=1 Tax=Tanacetum coccineum TaxID=301880 RepID=A0ABQ4XZM6_9ASTR
MEGTEMTKQERESMLYDEFDKFIYEPVESIHSYYLRFAKLINDMNMISMAMTPMQINTKFVNHLQPEWSKFVTAAKQARNLHKVTFDQLYAFLKHNEKDAKEALGYQNPLYLSQARRKQPALYNGHVLIDKEHNPVYVCDSEETLILAEESRLKMLERQTVFNTKLIYYSKLNKLYEFFVPRTQFLAEQLYWSSIPRPPVTVSKPTVFPKKLPSTSEVLRNLNKIRDLLTKFDECIKRRTTLSPHEIGSWEQSNIKVAFKEDVIPFSENLKETFKFFEKGFIKEVKEMKDIFEQMEDEVGQCSAAKKTFKIENKQLLINNDRLLEEYIASDIMCTYLRSLNEVDNCGKCKSLDTVLLDLQE